MRNEAKGDRSGRGPNEYRYLAFISYSSADSAIGESLQRRIEEYKVPATFRGRITPFGTLGRRIRPIFRDRSDMEAHRDLDARIREALQDSTFLIVLCSPRSAASKWVNQEIVEFKRQGRAGQIITVLVAGEPEEFDAVGTPAGAFAPALVREIDAHGDFTGQRESEPVAADLRGLSADANGFAAPRFVQEFLKIIAAMTAISLTELSERTKLADRIEKRNRLVFRALVIATVALVVVLGARYWMTLKEQSVYLASLAREAYAKGDSNTAAALALEAVPKSALDRPGTAEAENAVGLVLWRFPLHRFEHRKDVSSARFDQLDHRVVTTSSDRTVVIWDVRTGISIVTMNGHVSDVTYAEFSSDGTRVISASYDGTARIWDANSGAELLRLENWPNRDSMDGRRIWAAHFSPNGRFAVTVGGGNTARLWDVATGRQTHAFEGFSDAVFSPDGGTLLLGPANGNAAVLADPVSGRELRRFVCGDTDERPRRVRFSPDGHRIAAGGRRLACVWATNAPTQRTVLQGHEGSWGVNDVNFSPDGKQVVTAGSDGTARVWDVSTGMQLLLVRQPPYVSTAVYSPDGTRIISASQDKTARIWDARTGSEIARLDIHTGIVQMAEFSNNGSYVVTASNDHTAGLWDFVVERDQTDELCRRVPLKDRVLRDERRSSLNLPATPRDPCRPSYFGVAPALDWILHR